jgi:hypothetical protein
MFSYYLHRITADGFYRVWAVVGPLATGLVGVVLGAWLTACWQRKKWILDNKTTEYRGILDALNSYRWQLVNYNVLYGPPAMGVSVKDRHDAQVALAQAFDAVSNAFPIPHV